MRTVAHKASAAYAASAVLRHQHGKALVIEIIRFKGKFAESGTPCAVAGDQQDPVAFFRNQQLGAQSAAGGIELQFFKRKRFEMRFCGKRLFFIPVRPVVTCNKGIQEFRYRYRFQRNKLV